MRPRQQLLRNGQQSRLTPADAQAVQDRARAAGEWVVWFVSTKHPAHPARAVAWAMVADPSGGRRLPGMLVAGELDELRRMLPAGLTRRERSSLMAPEVIEASD